MHVLDCATLEPGRDPITDLDTILAELAAYDEATGSDLLERPALVALNKIDVPEARELAAMVRPMLEERGYAVHEISAATHEGMPRAHVRDGSARARRPAQPPRPPEATRIVLRPAAVDEAGFTVTREADVFRVLGSKPERWVRQTDFTNDEAVGYLADRLARLGVEAALVEAGAEAGDGVAIGPGRRRGGLRLGADAAGRCRAPARRSRARHPHRRAPDSRRDVAASLTRRESVTDLRCRFCGSPSRRGGDDGRMPTMDPVQHWHVTLTLSGEAWDEDAVRAALHRLLDEHPFLQSCTYAPDTVEMRYWDQAETLQDAAAMALRLWGEHRRSAGLPPWTVVGLEVVDRTDDAPPGGRQPAAAAIATVGELGALRSTLRSDAQ